MVHTAVMGGKIDWLPTLTAENHFRWEKTSNWIHPASTQKIRPAAIVPVLNPDKSVRDDLKEILDVVAKNDLTLASGHLHVSETWIVFEEAKKRGVNKTGAHHVDASAYDIVYVYADVMRRAGISGDAAKLKAERTAIRDALAATNLDGVVGKVCFSKERDSELAGYIIRIKNGQRTLLDSHAPDRCM